MLSAKVNPRLCVKRFSAITTVRKIGSAALVKQNEVAEAPEYPPINDLSLRAINRGKLRKWHEEERNVKTVEEKMIKMNMPRYWGFRCMMYEEDKFIYNELPHAQYITKTHVVNEPVLPSVYDNIVPSEKLESLTHQIKDSFEEGIAFELSNRKRLQELPDNITKEPKELDDIIATAIAKQINRIMLLNLGEHYPHLQHAEVDWDPRIEAFWFAGGIVLQKGVKDGRKLRKWDEIMDEPVDTAFQYVGKPSLQLRHFHPLKEIIPLSECENPDFDVPTYKFDPRSVGHAMKRRHGINIPGFWPGDPSEFGLLSFHKRGYLVRRGFNDDIDALKSQAIYANYGWLLSQAANLGFSCYNDITYPLVNQAVITNGQWWSFCVYQLNTILLSHWYHDDNPKRNICWITEPMKLYDSVEGGKLVGFNDEVMKNLIKFYANVPEERIGVEMKPYLGKDEKLIADIEFDEKREWLEDRFKILQANRPRHRLMPELPHWEQIYKFKFQTRPLDKRRTPYDFGVNPFLRRLDQHVPAYIPKKLRPEGKHKIKWAATYYPKSPETKGILPKEKKYPMYD